MDIPYEANTRIDMECSIERIYPIPSNAAMFNITFLKNNKSYETTNIKTVTPGSSVRHMSINGSLEANLDYDNDTAICQVTTTLGHYFQRRLTFEIFGRFSFITIFPKNDTITKRE